MSKPRKRQHRLSTLFERIGEAAVTFAMLDIAVDACINALHKHWGGPALIPHISFNRKTGYLREWYASEEKWKYLFSDFDELIDLLDNAALHRHRLIHGVAIGLQDYPTTGVSRHRRRLLKQRVFEYSEYRLRDIRYFSRHMVGLAAMFGILTEILSHEPVPKKDGDDSFRAILERAGGLLPPLQFEGDILDKRIKK